MQSGAETKEQKELIIPKDFNCPVTLELMTEPVISPIGRSYEKEMLEKIAKTRGREPLSGDKFTLKEITPNPALKLAMQDYHRAHDKKLTLNQIYKQRGAKKIKELTQALYEIQEDTEFKMNHEVLIWPFPLICPRSCTIIKNPVTTPDGTTYEKLMSRNLKQKKVPNLTLQSILPIFKLELDDTLKAQFKKMNQLRNEVNKALAERDQIIQRKHSRRKLKSYSWSGIKFFIPFYGLITMFNFACKDIFDAHNELAPPNERWSSTSDLLQPFVTSAFAVHTMIQQNLAWHPNWLDKQNFDYNRNHCRKRGKESSCRRAIDFALHYRRYLILKGFYKEFDIRYFVAAAEDAVQNGDVESLQLLHRLDPAILQGSQLLLMYSIKNPIADQRKPHIRISTVIFLLSCKYPVDQSTDHLPTPLMSALQNNDLGIAEILLTQGVSLMQKNGESPLSIAVKKNNTLFAEKIIAKDPALAKQMLSQNKEWLTDTIAQENLSMLSALINFYPADEVRSVFVDAVKNDRKKAVTEILKTNIIDRDTVKKALIEAHHLKPKLTAIYNLLRTHLRSTDAVVVPHRYAFYQPAQNVQSIVSKQSQRRVGKHR